MLYPHYFEVCLLKEVQYTEIKQNVEFPLDTFFCNTTSGTDCPPSHKDDGNWCSSNSPESDEIL